MEMLHGTHSLTGVKDISPFQRTVSICFVRNLHIRSVTLNLDKPRERTIQKQTGNGHKLMSMRLNQDPSAAPFGG